MEFWEQRKNNELYYSCNKDLFLRETLLETMFDYFAIVMIMRNSSNFIYNLSISSEPLSRIIYMYGLSFLCDNVFSIRYM